MTRMSLRARILTLIAATQAALLAALAVLSLAHAREAVAVEVRAGAETARSLVLATIGTMQGAVPPDRLMDALPERLVTLRHARIGVLDARTGGMRRPPAPPGGDPGAGVPAWFARLIAPPPQETRLPVVVAGRMLGFVFISTDPGAEVAEIWRDTRVILALTALAALAQGAAIAAAVGRGLSPLSRIAQRLADLARGDLGARVGTVTTPDLAALAAGVDALGRTLERAETDRARLSREVVTRGDAERRAIARDLHDEFGPCLFALRVEAEAIRDAAPGADMTPHAAALTAIAAEITRVNRALLDGLRPMAVGQLPLAGVLRDHVDELNRRFPDLRVTLEVPPDLPEPDEATAITLYRIVQEGTTNALRHARAATCAVRLWTDPAHVHVAIRDDGRGIPPGTPPGNGLSGMRERVVLLGGALDVRSDSMGTELHARMPLTPRPANGTP